MHAYSSGHRRMRLAAAGLLILATTLGAQVPSGGPYSLPRQLIGGGGERLSGGSYSLVGSVGQANTGTLSGGAYTLQQGFHTSASGGPLPDALFQNGFE